MPRVSLVEVPVSRLIYPVVLVVMLFAFFAWVMPAQGSDKQNIFIYMPRSYCDQVPAVADAVRQALALDADAVEVTSGRGLVCSVKMTLR